MFIRFFVAGTPYGQPRPRATVRGKHAAVYHDKKHPSVAWRASVALAAKQASNAMQDKLQLPRGVVGRGCVGLAMELLFLFARPQSMVWKRRLMPRAWHTGKPDADNLAKVVLDAGLGILYDDDGAVCSLDVSKQYAAGGEEAGVWVVVQPVSEPVS